MGSTLLYLLWVFLFVLSMAIAWLTTLFALPGNWIIVAVAALFAYLFPGDEGRGVAWIVVGVLFGLAVFGEVVEFAAGAAGAKKVGGSRRSVLMAIVGTMIGSIVGAMIGVPIPIFGPIIGALGGGAAGAFAGAFLGEQWIGSDVPRSVSVGKGAFVGRLWGTAGKLAVGIVMIVIATVDALL